MAEELPPDLLDRRPEEAVRLIALWRLAEVNQARQCLDDPDNGEALHDLRVALRRLRSSLRSYRELLRGSVRKPLLRQLKDVAGTSGPARDAEVQLEWLKSQHSSLAEADRPGLKWLEQHLTSCRDRGNRRLQRALARRFPRIEAKLDMKLRIFRAAIDAERPPAFRAAAGTLVRAHLQHFLAALSTALQRDNDAVANHDARIEAKRLRYLVEPLVELLRSWKPIVDTLKSLQDILGELHDAQVMEEQLDQLPSQAPPEAQHGLRTLYDRSVKRSQRLFAQLKDSQAPKELSDLVARMGEDLEPVPASLH